MFGLGGDPNQRGGAGICDDACSHKVLTIVRHGVEWME